MFLHSSAKLSFGVGRQLGVDGDGDFETGSYSRRLAPHSLRFAQVPVRLQEDFAAAAVGRSDLFAPGVPPSRSFRCDYGSEACSVREIYLVGLIRSLVLGDGKWRHVCPLDYKVIEELVEDFILIFFVQ